MGRFAVEPIHKDIKQVLYTQEELQGRIHELGKQITTDHEGESLLVVGILRGAVIFMADLIREIDLPLEIDFMALSSYGSGTKSSGTITVQKDLVTSIEGRHVLIVEDILDTGLTLRWLLDTLGLRNPASIEIAVLLRKNVDGQAAVCPRYTGFTCPNKYIVGYGLDYDERYRNLPYIGELRPEIYA